MPSIGGPITGDIEADVVERDVVESALRRLDPSWRAIVVLHYFLGMPLPEASAILGIPLGTAKSRLHRAIGLMRDTLADEPAMEFRHVVGGNVS